MNELRHQQCRACSTETADLSMSEHSQTDPYPGVKRGRKEGTSQQEENQEDAEILEETPCSSLGKAGKVSAEENG